MMKVTLDTNVVIDLEQNNKWAPYIRELVRLHTEEKLRLRIAAIGASEKKPDETYISNFNEFKRRIEAVGLSGVEILASLFYLGISFLGYCVIGGEKSSEPEEKIQKILFPKIEMQYPEYCRNHGLDPNDSKAWQDWVNAKCDALSLWCHIWYKGDIFVTRDNNFHKKTKKPLLIALGAGDILRPDEAVAKLRLVG